MSEQFTFVSMADLRAALADILQGAAAARKEQEPETELLTTKEVCGVFGIAPVTLWKWNKRGYLVPVKVGGKKLYYNRADVERIKAGRV